MGIRKFMATKPVNSQALEKKIDPKILRKIDADLKEVIAAREQGLKAPGSYRLRQFFIDEYQTPISTNGIQARIAQLSEKKADGKQKSK